MINIQVTQSWNDFVSIYGSKDIQARYQWFLFEFGKRASKHFYKHILQQISTVPGTSTYRKSLMLAEMRDRSRNAWWAIVASGKPIGKAKHNPKTSLLIVASRYEGVSKDPVSEILESMGPWTVDTIPFIPNPRAGQVVLKQVSEEKIEQTKESNLEQGDVTRAAMIKHGIPFTPRHIVYDRLRVIEDVEMTALRIEFGLDKRPKAHWRPSLRWIKRQGIQALEKEIDLIAMWIDPSFGKYRLFRHFRVKFDQSDVNRIQKFQKKVRV